MTFILTGFYIGILHIFGGVDHLAALVPLSLADRKKTWRVGFVWGIGHLLGVLLLGIFLFYFKSIVNTETLSHYSHLYIGLLLISLGFWIIYNAHFKPLNLQTPKPHTSKITFWVGVLHGIAGISHIYSLLPSITLPDFEFYCYFAGFVTGSIVSVTALTYFLRYIPERYFENPKFYQISCYIGGGIAIAVGLFIALLFWFGSHSH